MTHRQLPCSTVSRFLSRLPHSAAMSSYLRCLLLCALVLLSSSVSVSSISSSSPSTGEVASVPAVMLLRIDPSEDSQVFDVSYFKATFDSAAATAAELPSSFTQRPDSMFGAVDGYVADTAADEMEAEADHAMHPMQTTAQFTMQRLSANAPWSPRIQPGLMYRTREISYLQVNTGVRVRLGSGYLLMYEGAMTNRSGPVTYSIENDVWVSNDEGRTWDLVAGRSEYGRTGPISSPNNGGNTFQARSGSNNCNDPLSDLIVSLGGTNATSGSSTTTTVSSYNGIQWIAQTSPWGPQRHFSSCDITDRGDVLLVGGHFHANNNQPADFLLNDVWRGTGVLDSAYALVWNRQTAAAAFSPREEHLVLVGYSSFYKREIMYVIGGRVTCTNADCYEGVMSNDVWASSDYGVTWAALTANAPFGPRWGHGGWITRGEVLLVWGGLNTPTGRYADTVTQRDMWASWDGGYSWSQCATANTDWIRGEQGVVVNSFGQLLLVAGYAYSENGQQQVRYNDVWQSTFSVDNNTEIAARCGAQPAAGAGLRRWPGSTATPANTMTFTPATLRAPWSPRYKAGLLTMSTPLMYKTPDGTTASTGPDWLLLYEGQGLVSSNAATNENDVYASADNGKTWVMIAGNSFRGQMGLKSSAYPDTSFSGSISSANCEDPTTDDVYSIGGLRWSGGAVGEAGAGFWSTSDVWYSSNALTWNSTGAQVYSPARHGATCDVGHSRNVILIGGMYRRYENGMVTEDYYSDVWQSVNKGARWTRVTAKAAFAPRRDHAMQIVYSDYYGKDLVYVVGGRGVVGTTVTVFNDVWVSSNAGSSWTAVNARAQFSPRFEASVVVTSRGAMLAVGGRGQTDLWLSLNGGARWSVCRVLANQSVTDSSAVTLTADDRLVIASGSPRADVLLGDQRLTDPAVVGRHCGLTVPGEGVGLRVSSWVAADGSDSTGGDDGGDGGEGTSTAGSTDSSSSGTLSGLAIVGIVAAILAALAAVFGYWKWQQKSSAPAYGSDPSGLLGTSHGSVEGQTHNTSSLDSSLINDTHNGHNSL